MASQHLKVSVGKLNATCANPKSLFSKKDMDETKTDQAPVFTASVHMCSKCELRGLASMDG